MNREFDKTKRHVVSILADELDPPAAIEQPRLIPTKGLGTGLMIHIQRKLARVDSRADDDHDDGPT